MVKQFTLTKQQRISAKQEAKIEVFSCRTKHLVFVAKKNNLKFARVKIVVPKKHIALAVNRNRIKRWVRERFRLEQTNMPGIDLVVIARYCASSLTYPSCQQALKQCVSVYQKSC